MKQNHSLLISVDPTVNHGKPVVTGTRIMVWQILELLESGQTAEQIYTDYPSLPENAIPAVLHYAAERAKGSSFIEFKVNDNKSSHLST